MSTIIRATDRNRSTQTVAFNFDDMAARADQYLGKVRGEVKGIVAQAQQEAAAIRQRAEQEGRQAGMQAVEQSVREQLATALPALKQVIEDLGHAKQEWLRNWETSAVHVASAIAARLIRQELASQPEIALRLVREALELAAGSARLRIHLNADDCKAMGQHVEMLIEELAPMADAEIVPDAAITPGGCRVETQFGIIDQQFESQLKRIEEELT